MLSLNKLSIYVITFLLIVETFLKSELYSVLIYFSIIGIIAINKSFYTDKLQKTLIGILSSIILISFGNYYFDFRVVDYNISITDLVRDLWFFSRPIFLLIIGYNLGKKARPEELVKVIIIVGIISATLHYIELIQFGSLDLFEGRKSSELSGSSLIEALLFSIIIQNLFGEKKEKFESDYLNKWSLIILLLFITPSVVLYLSRTMFIVIFAFLFFGFELYKINRRSIVISSAIILLVGSLFIMESSEGIFINKIQRSVSEVGIGSDFENRMQENDLASVWRGYEAFRAVSQLFENNMFVWFFGEGAGSKVDLKFYQKLGGQEFRFIPQLHNGYVMVLFKSGIVGLLLYLYLMFKLTFGVDERSFLPVRNRKHMVNLVRGIGLSLFIISIVISGIYNKGEVGRVVLLYGAILGSLTYQGPYVIGLLKIEQ